MTRPAYDKHGRRTDAPANLSEFAARQNASGLQARLTEAELIRTALRSLTTMREGYDWLEGEIEGLKRALARAEVKP
jgi:hypothetical protein